MASPSDPSAGSVFANEDAPTYTGGKAASGGVFASEIPGVLSGSYSFIENAIAILNENISEASDDILAIYNNTVSLKNDVITIVENTSQYSDAALDYRNDAKKIASHPANTQYTLSDNTLGYSSLHYQQLAVSSASSAATSASSANGSASEANAYYNDAKLLAINPEDSQYTLSDNITNGYSALHYAAKAEDSSSSALTSSQLAEDYKDLALQYKEDAETAYSDFSDLFLGSYLTNPSGTFNTGALYYNTTNSTMMVYNGTSWVLLNEASIQTLTKYKYTATDNQTVFSGNDVNGNSLDITNDGSEVVMLNGIILDASDYSTTATSITLSSGASVNDVLTVYSFGDFYLGYSSGEGITDLVQDTSPQLGGNLLTNGNGILFGDCSSYPLTTDDTCTFGLNDDLRIGHHSLYSNQINNLNNSSLNITAATNGYLAINNGIYGPGHVPAAVFTVGGACSLYYSGSQKLRTNNTGITVYGDISGMGGAFSGDIIFNGDVTFNGSVSGISGGTGGGDLVDDTTPQLGGDLESNQFDIKFDDYTNGYFSTDSENSLIFGESNDLVIHHDSTNSLTTFEFYSASPLSFRQTSFGTNEEVVRIDQDGLYVTGNNKFCIGTDQTDSIAELYINTTSPTLLLKETTTNASLQFTATGYNSGSFIHTSGPLSFTRTFGYDAIKLESNGDVKFYDDSSVDGSDPRFLWDASTNYLRIGDVTNTTNFISIGSSGADRAINFAGSNTSQIIHNESFGGTGGLIISSTEEVRFRTDGPNTRLVVNNDGTTTHGINTTVVKNGIGAVALPQMTSTERDSMDGPQEGWMIYNTTTDKINFYTASGWRQLSDSAA